MLQRGFVLHRRAYSESSLLVDFFSESQGRTTFIAKGARRPRSPLKALLQPFNLLSVQLVGKSHLKTLAKVEGDITLPLDPLSLYSGFYVNEVLSRVIENETAYPELFFHYRQCLTQLAVSSKNVEPALRTFEFRLLQELGYGVDFTTCAATHQPIEPNMSYQFYENQGFVASLLQNNKTFLGRDLLAFDALDFSESATQQAAKRFTRIALKPYLGTAPLKSRELFQSILPHKLKSG